MGTDLETPLLAGLGLGHTCLSASTRLYGAGERGDQTPAPMRAYVIGHPSDC